MTRLEPEDPDACDLIVIGGGMAGLPIANKAAYKGLRTVLVTSASGPRLPKWT